MKASMIGKVATYALTNDVSVAEAARTSPDDLRAKTGTDPTPSPTVLSTSVLFSAETTQATTSWHCSTLPGFTRMTAPRSVPWPYSLPGFTTVDPPTPPTPRLSWMWP